MDFKIINYLADLKLISITWQPVPDSPKQVVISYRKTSDPDVPGSYIIVDSGSWVAETGIFTPPFVISGLNPTFDYTVKIVSVCGNYSYKQNFTYTGTASFTVGFTLGYDA